MLNNSESLLLNLNLYNTSEFKKKWGWLLFKKKIILYSHKTFLKEHKKFYVGIWKEWYYVSTLKFEGSKF